MTLNIISIAGAVSGNNEMFSMWRRRQEECGEKKNEEIFTVALLGADASL